MTIAMDRSIPTKHPAVVASPASVSTADCEDSVTSGEETECTETSVEVKAGVAEFFLSDLSNEFVDAFGIAAAFADSLEQITVTGPMDDRLACFHCRRPPKMSLRDYAGRVEKHFYCTGSCFVLGLIYIERVLERLSLDGVSRHCIHKLLLVSMVLAAKVHEDEGFTNTYYANVGGLRCQELNAMEAQLLHLLNYELFVPVEMYARHPFLCKGTSQ